MFTSFFRLLADASGDWFSSPASYFSCLLLKVAITQLIVLFFYLVQFSFSHLERPTPSLLVKPHCEFVYFYGCKKKKKTGKKEKEKHMRARTNQISLLSRVVAGGDDNFPVINEFR